jgi:hypothetical protein
MWFWGRTNDVRWRSVPKCKWLFPQKRPRAPARGFFTGPWFPPLADLDQNLTQDLRTLADEAGTFVAPSVGPPRLDIFRVMPVASGDDLASGISILFHSQIFQAVIEQCDRAGRPRVFNFLEVRSSQKTADHHSRPGNGPAQITSPASRSHTRHGPHCCIPLLDLKHFQANCQDSLRSVQALRKKLDCLVTHDFR